MTQPRSSKFYNAQKADNLARNNPVPNLFEEFTEVIAGELKSLTQQEFDAEYPSGYQAEYKAYPDDDGPPKPSLR